VGRGDIELPTKLVVHLIVLQLHPSQLVVEVGLSIPSSAFGKYRGDLILLASPLAATPLPLQNTYALRVARNALLIAHQVTL
jgi:hypothetical protein